MRWYTKLDGNTRGPFEESEIVAQAQADQVAPGTVVQAETGGRWRPVSVLLPKSEGSILSVPLIGASAFMALVVGLLVVRALVATSKHGAAPRETADPLAREQRSSAQGLLGGIQDRVATDAVQRYEIVKRAGEPVEVCVHAGRVAAAYLQAKNETKYQQWKEIERADCARSGMPK